MATTSQRRRRNQPKKKQMTPTSYVVIICILTFAAMAGLLFQHSSIAETNNQIRTLQKTLDEAVQVNDSKEGQLVTNMNLQAIEAMARGYGMKEPVQEQYRRETTTEKSQVSPTTETPKFNGWLENLF